MKKYDWNEIQNKYNLGYSQNQLCDEFGMSTRTIYLAIKRGEFTPRSISDGVKIHLRNNPRSKETLRKIGLAVAKTVNKKVEQGLWHTSLAKRMHKKYKGVNFHGNWELAYAKYLDKNKIKWIRTTDSFEYTFEGKKRRYTPDFYLPGSDEYIEIKGYKTAKDIAKWSQFPKHRKLTILMEDDLNKILWERRRGGIRSAVNGD